jgi:hypothetical protein
VRGEDGKDGERGLESSNEGKKQGREDEWQRRRVMWKT